MAIFSTCLKIAFFCIPVHKDEVPGLCTCENTRSEPRKTQSNTYLRHQNASEHASCANVIRACIRQAPHCPTLVFCGWSGVDFKPGRRTRRSTFDPGHTHTRTACERRKRVAKGCVCRGDVDGPAPTRAARGTRMVLHGLKSCATRVCMCASSVLCM